MRLEDLKIVTESKHDGDVYDINIKITPTGGAELTINPYLNKLSGYFTPIPYSTLDNISEKNSEVLKLVSSICSESEVKIIELTEAYFIMVRAILIDASMQVQKITNGAK